MTARHQFRVLATLAIALTGGLAPTASAQTGRGTNPNAPRLMISTFRNPDKKLGPDAAEAVRNRVGGDVSYRNLSVISRQQIEEFLRSSGYPVDEALSSSDANQLAKQLRADEYVEGTVEKTATGYEVKAYLILARDQNLVQPLGTFEGAKLEQVAERISREFQNAHKTYEPEKTCRLRAREGKLAEAQKEIANGLAAYPKSTWLRYCQMAMLQDQKKPPAEIVKVTEEILAIDPTSRPALREAIVQYDALGNKDKKIDMLQALYRAEPGNAKLQEQIVYELAEAGKFDLARPIVEKAVAENPGVVELVSAYYKILGAMKDWKIMAQVGEGMVKMDTSLADADFFDRQITAYVADSNYQKAAETAARAAAKFPKEASNWVRLGNLQSRIGQVQQSIVSLRRALEIDPKTRSARMLIIKAYFDQEQYDSAYVAMHEAIAAGEERATIGDYALTIGNRVYKAASAKNPKTVPDFQNALKYLAFADSLTRKPEAKFLIGVSWLTIGGMQLQEAFAAKSCDGTKQARTSLVEAEINIPAGGAFNPELARSVMGNLAEMQKNVDPMLKAYCKADAAAKKPKP